MSMTPLPISIRLVLTPIAVRSRFPSHGPAPRLLRDRGRVSLAAGARFRTDRARDVSPPGTQAVLRSCWAPPPTVVLLSSGPTGW